MPESEHVCNYYGMCPECGEPTPRLYAVDFGSTQYIVCDKHQVRWVPPKGPAGDFEMIEDEDMDEHCRWMQESKFGSYKIVEPLPCTCNRCTVPRPKPKVCRACGQNVPEGVSADGIPF